MESLNKQAELRDEIMKIEQELADKKQLLNDINLQEDLNDVQPEVSDVDVPLFEELQAWVRPVYKPIQNRYTLGLANPTSGYIDYSISKFSTLTMIQEADSATYDTLFYFIGGYDFNPKDIVMAEAVYELCLLKATDKSRGRYVPSVPKEELLSLLIKYEKGTPTDATVGWRIERREQMEQEALEAGIIYVPTSDKATELRRQMGRWFSYALKSEENKINKEMNWRTVPAWLCLSFLFIVQPALAIYAFSLGEGEVGCRLLAAPVMFGSVVWVYAIANNVEWGWGSKADDKEESWHS